MVVHYISFDQTPLNPSFYLVKKITWKYFRNQHFFECITVKEMNMYISQFAFMVK